MYGKNIIIGTSMCLQARLDLSGFIFPRFSTTHTRAHTHMICLEEKKNVLARVIKIRSPARGFLHKY